ncbi:2-polyprenyl-6-methoxyphenol hydroxylase-like FAD-dependent oxidoreductase [Kutzneria viridogrisea]|uniref:2-polyprenyl-6-methoxyphenol hydroxylase-like FAD-dependent oxidoreductase n=1 Tax=Kutzneria viridogrisea TaxID=47990 RepID=A0ABR6BAX9_9PSEU|nr:2-polyprenyl-6-methoxyphenol hydroxylase-like FAD-dependent oxidoreductase [Kutzneria viridogrisea]
MDIEVDVMIAGAGPVGLMLAAELGRHGVSVVVLERLTEPTTQSRAQGLHARTIQTLHARGLLDGFVDATAATSGRAVPKPHFAGVGGLDFSVLDTGLPTMLFTPQAETERILAEEAAKLGVIVRRGHEVTDLSQTEDSVTVTCGGYTLTARFLVGCDGGHSTVRKLAGIDFPGSPPTVSTILGEVRLLDPDAAPAGWTRTPRGVTVIAKHPTDGHSRVLAIDFVDIHVQPTTPPTLAELRDRVAHILGRPVPIDEAASMTRYGDSARIAERYRSGRILLAGDAAHVHYPIGGQGLNVGLQDAVNLGWKLAGHIAGRLPEAVLDTYEAERRPAAEAVLENTRAQMRLLHPAPANDALRELFGQLLCRPEVNRHLVGLISGCDIRYDLSTKDHLVGRFLPARKITTDARTCLAAELLRSGRPLLLQLTATDALRKLTAGKHLDVVTAVPSEPWEHTAVLARPDGYLAWAGKADDPTGLEEALRTWVG